jgi:hypothetical protein
MNNNYTDNRHPAQQPSGPNKYLHIAMQTKTPMTLHFTDGEEVYCLILSLDTLNLLVKVIATGQEMVVTRSNVKMLKGATNA